MCGIGGILRIVKPGDPDYPADAGDPRRSPSGAWLWHGRGPRDLAYAPVDPPSVGPRSDPRHPVWLIPESWLDALDEQIKWRGPDGAGRFRDRVIGPDGSIVDVALVHRRLAIIDLECGAQPMVVHRCPRCAEKAGGDRRKAEEAARRTRAQADPLTPAPSSQPRGRPLSAVVFNGCIYNHRDLRAELETKGHVFETDHSDTEVLPHGWREWEFALIDHLEGMYAFALWDSSRGVVVLARDRFGEKPLYFDPRGGRGWFRFASVPLAFPGGLELPPRREAIRDWLVWGFAEHPPAGDERSLSCGTITACPPPPGLTPGDEFAGVPIRRVEGLPPSGTGEARPAGPRPLDTDELSRMLESAVRSRLEADVPVGCFLSGGVDSSLVAWFASRLRDDLPALTLRMPDERLDESPYARAVAKSLGLRHVVLDCPGNAAEDLVRLISLMRVPFGDSSILPTYWVCRAASAIVKVALSGDGGDEMFFGYDRYAAAPLLRRWGRLLRLLPAGWIDRRDPTSRRDRLGRLLDAARGEGWPELEALFSITDRAALLESGAVGLNAGAPPCPTAEAARWFDALTYLPRDLLRKVDTASLAAGIEVRCPYLHPAVADYAGTIPARLHMQGGEPKHLLKELARRRLPREVVDRPKQGFAIPISDWFRRDFGGLRTLLLDMLSGDRPFGCVHNVLEINMAFVRQMLDEHWSAGGLAPMHTTRHVRPRDHGQRLFVLLSLAIWSRSVRLGELNPGPDE